ncbi:hypothetical protein P0D88_23175 [Paraburkholderia sp. RL18-103-BIB-C]|jgi:hypothetical protein|uniref:hypothetical protein n=1 Tax=unclassified Paraburkholderia TaxID=2615204 RepID=UPI0038B8F899
MQSLFSIGILSLALALPAAAFAQDNAAPPLVQPGSSQTGPHETPGQSSGRSTDTSGYGTEAGATSDSQSSHASRHYAPASNWGRSGLFAHH